MSEWISVKNELPNDNGFYKTKSVYYEDGRKMEFIKESVTANKYNIWFADSTSPTSSVTHWMPNE